MRGKLSSVKVFYKDAKKLLQRGFLDEAYLTKVCFIFCEM